MKIYLVLLCTSCTFIIHSQNIQDLFEKLPMPYKSCEEAFQSAEIEWEALTLDNDSIFQRAKSWAPGNELKQFSNRVDRLTAYIDKASEDNSFSLSAPSSITKEVMISIEELSKIRNQISKTWYGFRENVVNLNSDYWVPNELDNGCDQILNSMKTLHSVSKKLNEQLVLFKSASATSLSEFQQKFNEISKIKHPMVNNQILDELSNLVSILHELSNAFNFHYKNMVETRMAWNNAFCK